MALGIVGKKIGMSRVFAADGTVAPVTVDWCRTGHGQILTLNS